MNNRKALGIVWDEENGRLLVLNEYGMIDISAFVENIGVISEGMTPYGILNCDIHVGILGDSDDN